MALFRQFRGKRADLDAQEMHDGYAYFCIDDGTFHIDSINADGILQRKQINAKEAESLIGYNIATALNSNEAEIPTSSAVMNALSVAVDAIKPKCTNVTLLSAGWTGDSNPWSQVVTVNGVTANSKVDLQPTAIQIVEMQDNDIALMAENNDGVITIYAIGSKPTADYIMQALITEVAVV